MSTYTSSISGDRYRPSVLSAPSCSGSHSDAVGEVVDGAAAMKHVGEMLKELFSQSTDLPDLEAKLAAVGFVMESVGLRLETAAGHLADAEIKNPQ